jgi:hypothetical protein
VAFAAALRNTLAPYGAALIADTGWVPAPSAETTAQIMAVALVAVYLFLSHKWFTFSRGIRFQVARMGHQHIHQHIVRKKFGWAGESDSSPNRRARH